MWKRLFSVCLLALLVAGLLPVQGSAVEMELDAPSAILMDAATGTVLFEKNADEKLAPASVTKIMTLLLVMEALESGKITWQDMVTASDTAAAKGGSQVYLEPGEQMTMDEMLKSVVVSSANDCATALAEHVAGSESTFVAMMNERAAQLEMQNTHFVNCTGLDDGEDAAAHLTTARDIALMSRELLKHDDIRKYTTIWMDTVRDGQFGLSNTNKLVRFYEGTTGLKTGFTQGAGYCLSATAQRNGIELIAVVMHCKTSTERFESAKAMLDYGFANYALITPDLDVTISPIAVKLGAADTVVPVVQDKTPVLIDKALQSSVTRSVELPQELEAPIAAGEPLGVLRIEADGKPLKEIPLVAEQEIPRLTYWQIVRRLLQSICMG